MMVERVVEALRDGLLMRFIFTNGTLVQHERAIREAGAYAIEAVDSYKLQGNAITIAMKFVPKPIRRAHNPMTVEEVKIKLSTEKSKKKGIKPLSAASFLA